MSACALTAPSLIGIWKALVEAYLRKKVFVDGLRLSIWQRDEWMWQGSQKAWPVAFQQMIPGLTIGAAEAISLEGMTMLAAEVDRLSAHVYRVVAEMVEDDGKVDIVSGSSED
uniref:Uncharacterized protein n=1 Tax=Romanomermis culicivorax TaxID=13658 RepID=A0A915K9W7_ROMCU